MDGRRGDLEERLHVGLGGGPAVDRGVGVDEGQVLALQRSVAGRCCVRGVFAGHASSLRGEPQGRVDESAGEGPAERASLGAIPMPNEADHVAGQCRDAFEAAVAQDAALQDAEPDLDLIDPGSVQRRVHETKTIAVLLVEPRPASVGPVVVHVEVVPDDVDAAAFVALRQVVHEGQERTRVTVRNDATEHLARADVEGCQQRACPAAAVLELVADDTASPHVDRMTTRQRLHRFLVDAYDDSVLGGMLIEAADPRHLRPKVGIGGVEPVANTVRAPAARLQDSSDRTAAHSRTATLVQGVGHRLVRPHVSEGDSVVGRPLAGQLHNLAPSLQRYASGSAASLRVQQRLDAWASLPPRSPLAHDTIAAPDEQRDPRRTMPVAEPDDGPRANHDVMLGVPTPRQSLDPRPLQAWDAHSLRSRTKGHAPSIHEGPLSFPSTIWNPETNLRPAVLVRVGTTWILYDEHLHFFELAPEGLRPLPSVAPSSLPAIESGKVWVVESLAGPVASLVVDLDVRRGYTSPTDARTRLVLTGGAWQVERAGATAKVYIRTLTWADGRVLDVSEEGRWWRSPRAPALVDLGAPPADCGKPAFLDDTVIVGNTTYVFGRTCVDSSPDYVARFVGSERGEPVSFVPFTLYQPLHAVSRTGDILIAAAGCPGENGAREFVQGCYALKDAAGWHRVAGPKDPESRWATINTITGIPPVSVEYAANSAAWVVVGKDGDFYGGAGGSGPTPVGEVHRRIGNSEWERVALPHDPIGDGWVEKRFVAQAVAVPGNEVYVSGFWYYSLKPTPDRVRIKRRWALLRARLPRARRRARADSVRGLLCLSASVFARAVLAGDARTP